MVSILLKYLLVFKLLQFRCKTDYYNILFRSKIFCFILMHCRFRSLLEYLKQRYAPGGNSIDTLPSLNLPNTLKEFHSKYRLKSHQTGLRIQRPILEVTKRDEIISATVFNLVHSALCVATMDKTKLGPILFDGVSNSYPDVKIRETLNMMRKDTMVVRHKGANQRLKRLIKNST